MEAPRRKGVKLTPSSCSINNLPNPILMEILCRVSIKTLTTSKSVCKSWLDLIKDPQFCQMHQRNSPTEVCFQIYHDSEGTTLELQLGNFYSPNNLDPCHFQIPNFIVWSSNNVPTYEEAMKGKLVVFANSCNGLLCYYGNSPDLRFAMVWNPCTSEFITFPPPRSSCRGYGLGFSKKEDKFKLLRLIDGSKPGKEVLAEVCTIEKACSWKSIGPCSSHAWFRDYSELLNDLHAVYLNGTLHWVRIGSRRSCIAIHTFDFEDDHFGMLPLPPRFDETDYSVLYQDMLGVSGGFLFVTDYRNGGVNVAIWLMREYGVQGSWTKLVCSVATFNKGLQYRRCRPVTFMDNGEILITYTSSSSSSTACIYNPVQKSGRVIGSSRDALRVIAYNPSLVLLKDSMLGYKVRVTPMCAGLKQGEKSTTPYWWTPMKKRWRPLKESPQQHGSKVPLIDDEISDARATSESSASEESSASDTSESSSSEESSASATPESSTSE